MQEDSTAEQSASGSLSEASIQRARAMMTNLGCHNAIHVLTILMPGIEFDHFDQSGPDHSPTYSTRITINGLTFEGCGSNKKKAKLEAAQKALANLLSVSPSDVVADTQTVSDNSLAGDSLHCTATPQNPEPVGTSPIVILGNIRPCTEYFDVVNVGEDLGSPASPMFRMGVMIDGRRFEGVGTSKKIARLHAAEAGLRELFGLEFDHTSGGVPVFMGDESLWLNLKKAKQEKDILLQNINLPDGKHPVQLINELYPDAELSFGECLSTDPSATYTACIKIEDANFVGSGSSKKTARLNAAVMAINYLEGGGILQRRLAEKRVQKISKPKWQKPQRAAFLQNDAKDALSNALGFSAEDGENTSREVSHLEIKHSRGNRGGKTRSKRPKSRYDWRSRGEPWVSGGKLESLPLILPNMNFTNVYGNFDSSHAGHYSDYDGLPSFGLQPQDGDNFDAMATGQLETTPSGYYSEFWQQNDVSSNKDLYSDDQNFSENDFGRYFKL